MAAAAADREEHISGIQRQEPWSGRIFEELGAPTSNAKSQNPLTIPRSGPTCGASHDAPDSAGSRLCPHLTPENAALPRPLWSART